jgi:hypothetical protein
MTRTGDHTRRPSQPILAAGRDRLAGELETALIRPAELTPAAFDAIVDAFDSRDATGWAAALAAMLYARPDLARPTLIDRLAALLLSDDVGEPVLDAAAIALQALAATDLAAPAISALLEILPRAGLAPTSRARLIPLLRTYASWRPELLAVEATIELAGQPPLRAYRDVLLGHVLEPLLARAPERVTGASLERILVAFSDSPRLPYTLRMIGERRQVAPVVRRQAAELAASAFPARTIARAVLTRQPLDVLVVLNVRIGQGDEIIRLVALLEALLDGNPQARVVIVTPRPYLYDHPRVRPVHIRHRLDVDAALAERHDGVVHIHEPGWPEVAWDPALDARVRELIAAQRPALVITGDVGYNHFVYRSVALDGREISAERALDRLTVDNVYDPCHRLLAELGVRGRVAEEAPAGPSVLTGQPSADAERAWAEITAGLPAPIALVNPYGGARRIKGYPPERSDRLAHELTGLVSEGYGVVLLPNGTPWGTREATTAVVERLAPDVRRRVAVAPDPAEADPARRIATGERLELAYADRVMRLTKYFAASAALIVAVEGWLPHFAYALGRPFRLVLQAQSFGLDWHPPLRGPGQRLVSAISSHGDRVIHDALGAMDPPPLPASHRKPLLLAALRGLHVLDDGRAVSILVHALGSEDHDVRAAAVAGLGLLLPAEPARRHLLEALRDREPPVRLAAAEGLLASGDDYAAALGPRFHEYLTVHRDIARQNWAPVLKLGSAALPALFVAADGQNDAIRREARYVVARLLAELGPGPLRRRDAGG